MAILSKLALDELINNEMVKAVPRTIAFGDGQRFATMKVVSLGENVKQLMMGSVETQGDSSDISYVVKGVLRVCEQVIVKCLLANGQ